MASATPPSIRRNSLSSSGLSTAPIRRSNLSRRSERPSTKSRPFSVRYSRTTRLSSGSRSLRSKPSLSSLVAKRVTREGSISNLWLNSPWLIPSLQASSVRENQVPALTPVSRSNALFILQKAKPNGASNGLVCCAVSTDRSGVFTTYLLFFHHFFVTRSWYLVDVAILQQTLATSTKSLLCLFLARFALVDFNE